jgi:hypothetical protein
VWACNPSNEKLQIGGLWFRPAHTKNRTLSPKSPEQKELEEWLKWLRASRVPELILQHCKKNSQNIFSIFYFRSYMKLYIFMWNNVVFNFNTRIQ